MGYSIAITAKSAKAKAEILAFMAEHYRPYHEVVEQGEHDYCSAPTDDLYYCRGKLKVGINYGAVMGPERQYAYGIVYWMAQRVGRKVNFHGTQYPAYDYDSQETVIIFPSHDAAVALEKQIEASSYGWTHCNPDGWRWDEFCQREVDAFANLPQEQNPCSQQNYDRIKAELHRLSALWAEAHK